VRKRRKPKKQRNRKPFVWPIRSRKASRKHLERHPKIQRVPSVNVNEMILK
jgi:hypothetical protein